MRGIDQSLFRSLRFRLSAWNTAAVLLIVVVTLVGLRAALRLTLVSENDHVLLDDTYEVVLAVETFSPNLDEIAAEMERKARGHVDRGLFVQLLGADGEILITRGSPPALDASPTPPSSEPSLRTIGGYRIAERELAKAGVPRYVVRVGASLANVDNDVATVTRLMIAAGFVILFVAPLSGYLLAGRATRPLARIIATTARLRPSHMEERLPIRGTGDELDQLSRTINRFLDLLADYLDRNREFVANAAHELRSPLAAVQSSVEVTLNSARSVGEYQELLAEIADQCGQLRVLVNQLLLLAEIDAVRSPVELQPVRFDRLVERSIDMFRGAAEERGVSLIHEASGELVVRGNADRLRQVANNLIDNALKFTPAGGEVRVTLQSQVEEAQLAMTVSDTGIGISSADLPHIFERFYRGDKSRQRENLMHGNGLGLSICKSIVIAHGGTIHAESRPGRGATLIVYLPLATDSDADAALPVRQLADKLA